MTWTPLLIAMLALAVASGRECDTQIEDARNLSLPVLDLALSTISHLDDHTFHNMSSLRHLNLSHNTLTSVGKWVQSLENIHTLDVSFNNISTMEDSMFMTLKDLQWLNISNNELIILKQNWLQGLCNLSTANFSFNNINEIENGTFLPLTSLQWLDLQGNKLVTLKQHTFSELRNLKFLDLSSNNISVLENETFSPLVALQTLNLSRNRIEILSEYSFVNLGALQVLDISSNIISVINDGTFSTLTFLQRLNLSDNHMEVLGEKCFEGLDHLLHLDVSDNAVRSVSPGTFQPLAGLTELAVGGNPALGSLRQDQLMLALGGTGRRLLLVDASRAGLTHIPAALTRSISTLRLAGNAIVAVRCGDLDSYPLVRFLDLAGNRLTYVEEDALGRLEALETLRLDGNLISSVPRSLPASLLALDIQRNRITVVRAGELQGLPHLKELSFRECGIVTIEKGAFSQLLALESLDLSRNPLVSLTAATLSGPSRLRILRLSQLAKIQGDSEGEMAFPARAPEWLEVLELNASPVLARQLLADTAALIAFRQLRVLNLQDTGLTHLRSDLFHFLPHLNRLILSGNPWECGNADDILWLADWIRHQEDDSKSVLRTAICKEPPNFRSVPIMNLFDADFDSRDDNSTTTYSDSPTTSLPTPAYILKKSNVTRNDAVPVRTSHVIHIISNKNSSNNSHISSIVQTPVKTHSSNYKSHSEATLFNVKDHQRRLLLNITVLNAKNKNETINRTIINPTISSQFTFPNKSTALSILTASTSTIVPRVPTKRAPTQPTNSYKIMNDSLSNILPPVLTPSTTETDSNSSSPSGETPSSNQSQGQQKSFDSIMRDEYTPNPENSSDKSARISAFIDPLAARQKISGKETFNKQVKTFNDVVQSVGSFINETKSKLTMEHEGRKDKLPSSIRKLVDSIALAEREEMHEELKEGRGLNVSATATDETRLHKNTTDSWTGESLHFENVTVVVTGDKSVFYSSRSSDAFSSNERVTVKDTSAAGAGVPGSHPGMFVLLAVGVGVAAALAMALSHCAKRRRRLAVEYSRQQDIEVRSMSSIGDLW
ncbi:transforming growth factor beta activator LRRC32-like [Anabrus simplex]|uniref:transforming growth factor beta activator LRRC32-like n=1 Tax=Anabrus simplex TaxID=316456 RepID=UPI0035A28B87